MARYYVYELIDPRDCRVFYVGKGQADRAYHHERDARAGRVCNQRKHDRIADIVAAGHEVAVSVVARFADEQDALNHEAALIQRHGIENLTNVMLSGSPAYSDSGAAIAQRVKDRAIRWLAADVSEFVTAFGEDRKRIAARIREALEDIRVADTLLAAAGRATC